MIWIPDTWPQEKFNCKRLFFFENIFTSSFNVGLIKWKIDTENLKFSGLEKNQQQI